MILFFLLPQACNKTSVSHFLPLYVRYCALYSFDLKYEMKFILFLDIEAFDLVTSSLQ